MRIAIIGFQKSGKTTVFNALTGQSVDTSFASGYGATHQGVVKVPDARLDQLSALFKPKKHTPATVEYVDLAGIARAEDDGHKGEGLGEKQLAEITTADALMAVARGFTDVTGAPPDPAADIEAINLEMALSDLKKIDNRIERIDKQIGRAPTKERDALAAELEVVKAIKTALEEGRMARSVDLSAEQLKMVRGFQLLTMKPAMFLINEDEARWNADKDAPAELPASLKGVGQTMAARLGGQMEMEITQLPEEDRAAFLESYGIAEPAAHRVIRLCYELLGRISFLTVGPDECRAWTIMKGENAQQAAGTIHSDLERGFIRAEVIGWDDLVQLGGLAEAKKKGKLRLEGKAYIVQDGDVVNVLFSV